jgi:tRNA threonylcarbamoyl adenosine modification protein YeaZ
MKILAVEFSSNQRSVAVIDAGAPRHAMSTIEVVETGGREMRPFEMIDSALTQAGLEREQIECLALGLGPGSYTGIRAAIALAQGWQLARGVKLLGVSSADCLAAQAQTEGVCGELSIVIDAQRQEFYLAEYEITKNDRQERKGLRIVPRSEIQKRAEAGQVLVGPEANQWPSGKVLFPRAATLGQLASGRTDFVSGDKLEPIYLRETQFVKAPPPRKLPV